MDLIRNMFEDKPKNLNQPDLSGQGSGQVPGNLPIASQSPQQAGVEAQPPVPPASDIKQNSPAEPVDILADVENDKTQTRTPDKSPVEFGASVPPAIPVPEIPESKEPFFRKVSKPLGIVLALLIIGTALVVAGYFGYKYFFEAKPIDPGLPSYFEPEINNNQGAQNGGVNSNQPNNNVNLNTNNQPAVNTNQNIAPVVPKPLDTDLDGLSDKDEELYGTDPNKVDTDEDGLTDRDEVKVFETDPNNRDTDGDSYGDGDEVRSGFDPKGLGKLK